MGYFSSKKDGEPVWDQVTIDRLWATTQREAMIEAGPPPTPQAANPPAVQQERLLLFENEGASEETVDVTGAPPCGKGDE